MPRFVNFFYLFLLQSCCLFFFSLLLFQINDKHAGLLLRISLAGLLITSILALAGYVFKLFPEKEEINNDRSTFYS